MPRNGIEYVELATASGPFDRSRGLMRVLIGPPAAGKTTLCAAEGTRFGTCLSLDGARAALGAGAHDQAATPAAVEFVKRQAHAMLAMEAEVTIDATSTTTDDRATWLDIAAHYNVPAVAIIVWAPLEVALQRNAARARTVPEDVVRLCWERVTLLAATDLIKEGFRRVTTASLPDVSARGQSKTDTAAPRDRLARR